MSMTEDSDQPVCEQCGVAAIGAFVQYGSYFTQCTACGEQGPATSWGALSSQLRGYVCAISVTPEAESLVMVAEGEVHKIAEAIGQAAHRGQLIQLLATKPTYTP